MKEYTSPTVRVIQLRPQASLLAGSPFHVGDTDTLPVNPSEPHDPEEALTRGRGYWDDGDWEYWS